MEAINLIKLSGIIAQEIKVKHTPAGIFSASFWLVHNSTQANNSNSGGFMVLHAQNIKIIDVLNL